MNRSQLCIFIVLALGLLSCGKIENSNSTDKFRYGESAIQGSPQFIAAVTVIQKKCTFCHQHAQWNSFTAEGYINAGLVLPQSIEASPIYYRNLNSASGPGPKNMPTNGNPAMTPAEIALIATWINSL